MKLDLLWRKKTISQAADDPLDNNKLEKTLGVFDLTIMGIAAIIGAGIFSTIGNAAFEGGPGVSILFVITAVTCGFTALCYAEFAARVPVSGSAYTYSYVAFGELAAWIIGWALILEYAIGNIVVAISWSSYFRDIFNGVLQAAGSSWRFPEWLGTDPATAYTAYTDALKKGADLTNLAWTHAPVIGNWHVILNIPAFVITALITALVFIGIKESKRSANVMVLVKITILVIVIGVGIFYINVKNWHPFMPKGFTGVLKGVSAVFYAYIGFDAISTTAEECKNPQRDLPKGMIYSLVICTIIYVITTLVITGMVHYTEFKNISDPLAYVFNSLHMPRLGFIVSVSAVIAATSVILVFQLGQPRIWMSMSRDGLLPPAFARIHPRYKTPAFATIVAGLLVGIPSLFLDSGIVTDLTSIGTLFAFTLVCGGILALQKYETTGNLKFKVPYINGKFTLPIIFAGFLYLFSFRFITAFSNYGSEYFQNMQYATHGAYVPEFGLSGEYQELLFILFVLLTAFVTGYTIIKNYSLIPLLGMLCCMYLMIEIPAKSWMVFFIWMAVGLGIYFSYSLRNSRAIVPKVKS